MGIQSLVEDLCSDPMKIDAFKQNPDAFLEQYGLPEGQKPVALIWDTAEIRRQLEAQGGKLTVTIEKLLDENGNLIAKLLTDNGALVAALLDENHQL